MATDARGHTAPASGETPRRQVINDLSLSIRDPIPVANVTARTAKLAELAALSPAIVPSASNPIFFWRADASPGLALEVADGGTVRAVAGNGGEFAGTSDANGIVTIPHGLGYQPTVVSVDLVGVSSGSELIAQLADPIVWNRNATNIEVRLRRVDATAWFPSQPVVITWSAR